MELDNTKRTLELYQKLKDGNIMFQKDKPVIVDSSLAQLLGIYGMEGVITVEMEGGSNG